MNQQPHYLVRLGDGQIAVNEYGARDGMPVFYFHGWPSSRTQAALLNKSARELGLRLLSPDRPGIGKSTAQAGRTLLDWPPLLRQLAEYFNIGRFRVIGVSGGGPYALAAAWAMPERVEAVALVCGAPQIDPMNCAELMPIYRVLLRTHAHRPYVTRLLMRIARPFARLPFPQRGLQLFRSLHPAAALLASCNREVFDAVFGSYRASWESCANGVADDAEIYARPWGFPLQDINTTVSVWHGRDDQNFHFSLAENLASALPKSTLRLIEGESHFSLPINYSNQILADLAEPR